jgi:hypothetical protein
VIASTRGGSRLVKLFLCGDVMTGRGIDQILPHSSEPTLYEPYTASAMSYVDLAERVSGPIARPVDFPYVWGEALAEMGEQAPDLRIINLETSVTTSDCVFPRIAFPGSGRDSCCASPSMTMNSRPNCRSMHTNHVPAEILP